MSLSLLALTFVSAFCWSLFDLARKKVTEELQVFSALLLFMLLTSPLFLLWAVLLGDTFFSLSYFGVGMLGLGVNFTANALFIWAISISAFSQTVPMLSFAPVFSAVLSYFILGEHLNLSQIAGVGLTVVGALLLNGIPKLSGDSKGPTLAIIAAFFWALMGVLDKLCLEHASIPMHSFAQTFGIGILSWILLKIRKQKVELRRAFQSRAFFLGLGTLASMGAVGFQLYVVQFASVGLLESSKRAINLALTLVFGRLFFGEKLTWRKSIAVGVLALGLHFILG